MHIGLLKTQWFIVVLLETITVELHLSGLTGTARHPDMHKIRIIGFFFENSIHCQFDVRLLLFTVLHTSKPFDYA